MYCQKMKKALILFIKIYKILFSPFVGNECRFHPTCSEYGKEAIEMHGVVKGFILTMWRVLRCNPWNKNTGYDPVPPIKNRKK